MWPTVLGTNNRAAREWRNFSSSALALDGTREAVPDTPSNREAFQDSNDDEAIHSPSVGSHSIVGGVWNTSDRGCTAQFVSRRIILRHLPAPEPSYLIEHLAAVGLRVWRPLSLASRWWNACTRTRCSSRLSGWLMTVIWLGPMRSQTSGAVPRCRDASSALYHRPMHSQSLARDISVGDNRAVPVRMLRSRTLQRGSRSAMPCCHPPGFH